MNINIYLINADGSGSLVQSGTAVDDADAMVQIQALSASVDSSYRVEEQLSNGARIIGTV